MCPSIGTQDLKQNEKGAAGRPAHITGEAWAANQGKLFVSETARLGPNHERFRLHLRFCPRSLACAIRVGSAGGAPLCAENQTD
ncbi:hypothetical protein LMG28138_04137 [Pararobbsia alpina]|uniref:Uncharacterized protein n=1 Tax=Pararobbsia alpina TaxID=621374 RepID=A0A6S7BDL8_9BURK|nr:hypothetical protein LMG28138_04137 [Pararobbsia alpina]